jgi:hypothetical protein
MSGKTQYGSGANTLFALTYAVRLDQEAARCINADD